MKTANIDLGNSFETFKNTIMAEPFKNIPASNQLGNLYGYGSCLTGLLAYLKEVTEFNPAKRYIDSVPLLDKISASSDEIAKLLKQYEKEHLVSNPNDLEDVL